MNGHFLCGIFIITTHSHHFHLCVPLFSGGEWWLLWLTCSPSGWKEGPLWWVIPARPHGRGERRVPWMAGSCPLRLGNRWSYLPALSEKEQHLSPSLLFFPFFLGPHPQHMEVPRPGVKLELQLLAYSTAHSNAGSLTYWARPRVEPASSWIRVRFISHEPWWELLFFTTLRRSA